MLNRPATNLPNIPKTVRLVFSTGIIFLLIMSLLRLGLYLAFPAQGHSFKGVFPSFLLGLRFDLRYVGILCLLLLLLGSLPVFQPFHTVAGRRIVLSLTAIAAFLLVLFYAVDFAHYSYLSQRLNASVLNYLSDAGISTRMVWQLTPLEIFMWQIFKIMRSGRLRFHPEP